MTDQLAAAAMAVADKYDSRVVLYSGEIDDIGLKNLAGSVFQGAHRPNTFLILTTRGGQADAAYRIARFLQILSEKFYLFVPLKCKSAGTLIALGANEIVMSPLAELGPLDVQVEQRDEIGTVRSGLVVHAAMKGLSDETLRAYEQVMLQIKIKSRGTVSFEVASQIAASIATGIMAPIYAQIKPEDLGRDLRDLNVATFYGERLVGHGQNAKPKTVRHLVEGYPTHNFMIDASEAKALFRTVEDPPDEVTALVGLLDSASMDGDRSPCYVKRLDIEEEKDDEETTDETGDESAELDSVREDS